MNVKAFSAKKIACILIILVTIMSLTLFGFGNTNKAFAATWQAVCPEGSASSSKWSTSGNNVSVEKHDSDCQFYVKTDNNLRDEYAVSATFTADSADFSGGEVKAGLVPYYVDADNYVAVAAQWLESKSKNGIAGIVISGYMDGNELQYHRVGGLKDEFTDYFYSLKDDARFSSVKPDSALSVKTEKRINASYECYELAVYLKTSDEFVLIDTVPIVNFTIAKGSGVAKAGLYAYGNSFEITDVQFSLYDYATAAATTVGGWTCNGGANVWAYDKTTGAIKGNSHEGTSWPATLCYRAGTAGTSYYMAARFVPERTDNENYITDTSSSAYGKAEKICGIVPYYGDANNRLMVFFSMWSGSGTVNLVVENCLNGTPSGTEFRTKTTKLSLYGKEHLLETRIDGDEVSVYINRSKDPFYTTVVTGLSDRMAAVSPKYGVMISGCSAKFNEVKQSSQRIYASTSPAKVIVRSCNTVAKLGEVVSLDASAANELHDACTLTVSCAGPEGAVTLASGNNKFIPTVAGVYKLTLTAFDQFGNAGEVKEINVRAVSADTAVYRIEYRAESGSVGTMLTDYAVCDEDITLAENAYTYPGKNFIGWAAEKGSSKVAFANGQIVKQGIASEDGATVVLYAIFGTESEGGGDSSGKSGGCGGAAQASSMAVSALAVSALAFIGIKTFRKKEKTK